MSEKRKPDFLLPQEVLLDGGVTVELSTFTRAKEPLHPEANEDLFDHNGNVFVLADGSTPKEGNAKEFSGGSGGAVAARLVTGTVLGCRLNGQALVDRATAVIQNFYRQFSPEALTDARRAFATTFVSARLITDGEEPRLAVTQVGDTAFRINGTDVYEEARAIDVRDSARRAARIEALVAQGVPEAQAARLGRKAIEPSLAQQHKVWNNPDDPLGFGYVNGYPVPDTFVHEYTFALPDVQTIELISDGYPKLADEPSIASWEAAYKQVYEADPYRYKDYPATKSLDDRSVAVIAFR